MKRLLNLICLQLLVVVSLLGSIFRIGKGRNRSLGEARQVLIIRYDRLGDFVVSLPVFKALRSQFPGLELTVVLNESIQSLAEANRFYDDSFFINYARLHSSPWYLMKLIRRLRARKYDICFDAMVSPSLRSAIIAALSGASRSVGFDLRVARRFIFTDPSGGNNILRDGRFMYEGDLVWELFTSMGLRKGDGAGGLEIPAEVRRGADALLQQHGFGPGDFIIGMAPTIGGADRKREWPIENYRGLIARLLQSYPCKIVLLADQANSGKCKVIADGFGASVVDLAGKTDLLALCAVIDRVSVLVTAFTGTTHLGVALGKQVVTVCGGTDPHRWAGGVPNNHVVRLELRCSPCEYKLRNDQCSNKKRQFECVRDLDVGAVFDQTCKAIEAVSSCHSETGLNYSRRRN